MGKNLKCFCILLCAFQITSLIWAISDLFETKEVSFVFDLFLERKKYWAQMERKYYKIQFNPIQFLTVLKFCACVKLEKDPHITFTTLDTKKELSRSIGSHIV